MEDAKPILKLLSQSALVLAFFAISALLDTGCATNEVTSPPRSATEQLLLSTAADHALATVNLGIFSGQSVFLDFTYFDAYDSKYAEGAIRDAFSRAGATLSTAATNATVIVEPRSGAYSAETNSAFFGIPSIPLPIPSTSETPVIPALPFYTKDEERSYAKIALLAYSEKTHAHIFSSGSLDGTSYKTHRFLLIVSWWRTDLPEEEPNEKKAEEYQTWFPQYDLTNMPPPVRAGTTR